MKKIHCVPFLFILVFVFLVVTEIQKNESNSSGVEMPRQRSQLNEEDGGLSSRRPPAMSDLDSFIGNLIPVVSDGPPDPSHIPETVIIVDQIDDQLVENIYQSLKYEGRRTRNPGKIEADHWKEGLDVLILTEPDLLYERVKVGYIQGDFFLYVFSEDFNFKKGYAVQKKTRKVFSWDLTSDE